MKCLLDPCIGLQSFREPMLYPPYNNWYILQILLHVTTSLHISAVAHNLHRVS